MTRDHQTTNADQLKVLDVKKNDSCKSLIVALLIINFLFNLPLAIAGPRPSKEQLENRIAQIEIEISDMLNEKLPFDNPSYIEKRRNQFDKKVIQLSRIKQQLDALNSPAKNVNSETPPYDARVLEMKMAPKPRDGEILGFLHHVSLFLVNIYPEQYQTRYTDGHYQDVSGNVMKVKTIKNAFVYEAEDDENVIIFSFRDPAYIEYTDLEKNTTHRLRELRFPIRLTASQKKSLKAILSWRNGKNPNVTDPASDFEVEGLALYLPFTPDTFGHPETPLNLSSLWVTKLKPTEAESKLPSFAVPLDRLSELIVRPYPWEKDNAAPLKSAIEELQDWSTELKKDSVAVPTDVPAPVKNKDAVVTRRYVFTKVSSSQIEVREKYTGELIRTLDFPLDEIQSVVATGSTIKVETDTTISYYNNINLSLFRQNKKSNLACKKVLLHR